MGIRDRTFRPKSSNYITPAGAKRLRDELEQLWTVERPRVTQEVADAAAQGDRSENAEYIYGKKRLREIDRRVRWLGKRIDDLIVVDEIPRDGARVHFGAWVKVEDEDGAVAEWRIVGADETEHGKGWISVDAPVARALIGKRLGDDVTVIRPAGEMVYTIIAVRYADAW